MASSREAKIHGCVTFDRSEQTPGKSHETLRERTDK